MVWNSLRARIVSLAILTCIFFGVAAGSFYFFLRNNHALTVGAVLRQLSRTVDALERAYTQQVANGVSLAHVQLPLPPREPPPSPPMEVEPGQPPPPPPILRHDPFAQITSTVLLHQDGVEGGFLAASGALVGYAFPTHEGPGPRKEMPLRERATIEDLARRAKDTGAAQQYTFDGDHDVVLFAATPVRQVVNGKSEVTGAAWLMQRLPGVNAGRTRQLLVAALGLGGAALVTAVLAWLALFEIRDGLELVRTRLSAVKTGQAQPERVSRSQLQEFRGVLNDIDEMALTLERRTGNEQKLEAELRHRERLSALGQFAAGVAHELRNPLATIRLRAQMSGNNQSQLAVVRNSQVIQQEVDRLDVMIERLLSFSRPISLNRQLIDVTDLCRQCVEVWKQRTGDSVTLRCEESSELIVLADRNRLNQVLDNLIENAVQAVQERGGMVVVQATEENDIARVSVSDDGPGFSSEAVRHALDPFYTTKDAGTGLGLSIAFELIQAHEGSLNVSDTKQGATVSFTIPMHQVQGAQA